MAGLLSLNKSACGTRRSWRNVLCDRVEDDVFFVVFVFAVLGLQGSWARGARGGSLPVLVGKTHGEAEDTKGSMNPEVPEEKHNLKQTLTSAPKCTMWKGNVPRGSAQWQEPRAFQRTRRVCEMIERRIPRSLDSGSSVKSEVLRRKPLKSAPFFLFHRGSGSRKRGF